MEPFMIFTSSAMVDHTILYYFPQQHFTKRPTVTGYVKKQKKNFVHAQKCFYVSCEF